MAYMGTTLSPSPSSSWRRRAGEEQSGSGDTSSDFSIPEHTERDLLLEEEGGEEEELVEGKQLNQRPMGLYPLSLNPKPLTPHLQTATSIPYP
jgi:hypothetical protein